MNFNQEIYLEVNLGPTYRSEALATEVFELRKKEYIYKEDNHGRVMNANKVVSPKYGSAITTYRKNQDKKSRFPAIFWQ